MAVVAYIDRIDTLEAEEADGVIVRLVKRARVVGLTDTTHVALFSALAAAGIPVSGATLAGAPELVLTRRITKLVEGDRTAVDVDLVYDHALNKGQSIDTPHYGLVVGEVSASINQVGSNLDENGNPIVLSHTYPSSDVDYAGQTKVQGGEITFAQPQVTVVYKGIKNTLYPWLVSRALVGNVNSTSWGGRPTGEWLCTACNYRPYDGTNGRYEFSIEFQHNPDGWDPTAVFLDDRTGKPPSGLVQGTGYKTVSRYQLVDFEAIIGARLQGG